MKKFMYLYMASVSPEERMGNLSQEEMAKMMAPWVAWKDKIGDALVDFGTPLGNGMHVVGDQSSKSDVHATGYTIVQAEDMDAAKALLAGHPYTTMPDSSVEIFELMPMNM